MHDSTTVTVSTGSEPNNAFVPEEHNVHQTFNGAPAAVARPPPSRLPLQGNLPIDEYFKNKVNPVQRWLKLNEMMTTLAEFTESSHESSSASEILSFQDEHYFLSVQMRIALCDWAFVPKNIQKLVMDEFPLGRRVAKTPQKSEEEFLQMLVDKYNIGEL